jgi:hypothetical protein
VLFLAEGVVACLAMTWVPVGYKAALSAHALHVASEGLDAGDGTSEDERVDVGGTLVPAKGQGNDDTKQSMEPQPSGPRQ